METTKCPCCNSNTIEVLKHDLISCLNCKHLFRKHVINQDYKEKHNRNKRIAHTQQKNAERLEFLSQIKFDSLIDVGCAEGFLGSYLKESLNLKRVDGVELSMDKIEAAKNLDHVYDNDIRELDKFDYRYEVLSLFHVVEHIQNPVEFLKSCLHLTNQYLCIEVPNRSGNLHVEYDLNAEHIHFFSTLSIMHLLESVGLKVLTIETGGFESPRYNDCIRVIALKPMTKKKLLNGIIENCGDKFYVYGTGGNFDALIKPVDDIAAHVIGVLDKVEKKEGVLYDYFKVQDIIVKEEKILVTSIDFFEEIKEDLIRQGISLARIVGIEDILAA